MGVYINAYINVLLGRLNSDRNVDNALSIPHNFFINIFKYLSLSTASFYTQRYDS
ncbi:hypothetical protein VIRA109638_09205 [Vibrio rarus]